MLHSPQIDIIWSFSFYVSHLKNVSEYDQEIIQSQTADQLTAL